MSTRRIAMCKQPGDRPDCWQNSASVCITMRRGPLMLDGTYTVEWFGPGSEPRLAGTAPAVNPYGNLVPQFDGRTTAPLDLVRLQVNPGDTLELVFQDQYGQTIETLGAAVGHVDLNAVFAKSVPLVWLG